MCPALAAGHARPWFAHGSRCFTFDNAWLVGLLTSGFQPVSVGWSSRLTVVCSANLRPGDVAIHSKIEFPDEWGPQEPDC